jgi:serine/threonine protein kinase
VLGQGSDREDGAEPGAGWVGSAGRTYSWSRRGYRLVTDIFQAMLIYDPAGRISAKQALLHEYFLDGDDDATMAAEPVAKAGRYR